jgi:PAS domain S-box-containing protein
MSRKISSTRLEKDFYQQLEGLFQSWTLSHHSSASGTHSTAAAPPNELNPNHQSSDLFQALVENSQQGLAIMQDFKLIYTNTALLQMTGYTLHELHSFSAAIIKRALDNCAMAWNQVVEDLVSGVLLARKEFCFSDKTGKAIWLEVFAQPIEIEGKKTIIINCVDVSERKSAEEALYQSYSKLELELRQRSESLQREINERRQSEQEIQLLYAISCEIEQTQDFTEAMLVMLKRVCEVLEWNLGVVWMPEEHKKQVYLGAVYTRDDSYKGSSVQVISCPKLPKRVIKRRQPVWIENLETAPKALFSQQDIVKESGLKAAFAVPIMNNKRVLAVLVFFKSQSSTHDERLINVISTIAAQIGSILERKQAEEEKEALLETLKQQREQLRHLAKRRQYLAREIVIAQEEERRRVSRELHDEAGQALTVLKLSLEMIQAQLDKAEFKLKMSEAIELCDTTSAQIRALAHDLRPGALDDLGLNLALEGVCTDFSERTQSLIQYIGDDVAALSDAAELCLYRFLQEGLNNVTKHAGASTVRVRLGMQNNNVTLAIKDDGKGFDTYAVLGSTGHIQGIGLLGLSERLESLGGVLSISSEKDKGTSLVASIPTQKGS